MNRNIHIATKELLGTYINLKVICLVNDIEVASTSIGGKTKEELDMKIQEWASSLEAAQLEFDKVAIGEIAKGIVEPSAG